MGGSSSPSASSARTEEPENLELFFWFFVSCTSAQLVNYYCYSIIGQFSALTYQLIAHSKTILIFLVSLLFFPTSAAQDPTHLAGLIITVLGIAGYSAAKA